MNWDARSSTTQQSFRRISFDELRQLVLDGDLAPDDWVRNDDNPTWRELGTVVELNDAIPAFNFRRRLESDASDDDEMDMTPMIDVVFQLLIFFMLTASFHLQKSLPLPAGESETKAQEAPTLGRLGRDSIVVAITPDSKLEIWHYNESGALTRKEDVDPVKLVERLREISRAERKTELVVQANDRAQHGALVGVIDAAQQAELENIRLVQPTAGPARPTPPTNQTENPSRS